MSKNELSGLVAVLSLILVWWDFLERPSERSFLRAMLRTLT